jgi:hypothetical protein
MDEGDLEEDAVAARSVDKKGVVLRRTLEKLRKRRDDARRDAHGLRSSALFFAENCVVMSSKKTTTTFAKKTKTKEGGGGGGGQRGQRDLDLCPQTSGNA